MTDSDRTAPGTEPAPAAAGAGSSEQALVLTPPAPVPAVTLGQASQVSSSLVALRRQVEDLDPSRGGMGGGHKLLGILPFGNRVRDYFHRYQSSQHNIEAIIQALYRGQEELQRDNAAIEQEK